MTPTPLIAACHVLQSAIAVALIASSADSFSAATIGESRQPPPYKWTRFVSVDGQPEPVPVEWVATPEGKFAHSIKIPNPVPKDSRYRRGMSAKEYFDHLCRTEAGEFIFKTADSVDGILFMRPPTRPTDYDLMDRYKLEAPDIERIFQLYRPSPGDRSAIFVTSEPESYRFVEEYDRINNRYIRAFGFESGTTKTRPLEFSPDRKSQYGLTWRGIRRVGDRENGIAGNEWIVLDLRSNEVMAVFRNFARSGETPGVREGIWWLNGIQCPSRSDVISAGYLGRQLNERISVILRNKSLGPK